MINNHKVINTLDNKEIHVSDRNYKLLRKSLQDDKISIKELEKILRENNLALKKDKQYFKIKNLMVN
jgi:5-bromo-4-chloroindolyl phosphate hydrolysis protein